MALGVVGFRVKGLISLYKGFIRSLSGPTMLTLKVSLTVPSTVL